MKNRENKTAVYGNSAKPSCLTILRPKSPSTLQNAYERKSHVAILEALSMVLNVIALAKELTGIHRCQFS